MSKQRRFLFFLPKIVFSFSLSLISVSLAFSIIRLSLANPPKTKPLWNAVNYQWPPWATNLCVCVCVVFRTAPSLALFPCQNFRVPTLQNFRFCYILCCCYNYNYS
ncbi:hypothetical protein LOK49_LG15G02559 [Camellia lanceoleosa]|uniref:Uncharacterized protein n=1 Tax=Camellia lanceoleosa TaxID=1840588 RepID=A0ACC0F3P5_9ERIC|nr:hypothetical protein LOK49_LG15G02559 [Camellia lanceoleosa]